VDSITQASLGAVVAYATWNKPMKNSAFIWGAVLGTLPDLDVVFRPLLNQVDSLYWHRGESHSMFFIVIFSFLLAFLMKKRYQDISYPKLYWGLFFIFFTHILIDYFTIYGTQLLAPISRYGFAHGNFFIIDPLFTLPLLFAILFISIAPKTFGRKTLYSSLGLVSLYTTYSLVAHAYADSVFKEKLQQNNIEVKESITSATPFNTILWRNIAKVDGGFYISYYSLLANSKEDKIHFQFVPQNEELLTPFDHQENIEALKWFSKGFYILRKIDDQLILSDLRFGEIKESQNEPISKWGFAFSWQIDNEANKLKKIEGVNKDMEKALKNLYRTVLGDTGNAVKGIIP
jgi:inner membrane protein